MAKSTLCPGCAGTGAVLERKTFRHIAHAACNGTGDAPRLSKRAPKLAYAAGSKRRENLLTRV